MNKRYIVIALILVAFWTFTFVLSKKYEVSYVGQSFAELEESFGQEFSSVFVRGEDQRLGSFFNDNKVKLVEVIDQKYKYFPIPGDYYIYGDDKIEIGEDAKPENFPSIESKAVIYDYDCDASGDCGGELWFFDENEKLKQKFEIIDI